MKHRVKHFIASLQNLPEPEGPGQILKVPIQNFIYLSDPTPNKGADPAEAVPYMTVTLEATRFSCNDVHWIEWVIDV